MAEKTDEVDRNNIIFHNYIFTSLGGGVGACLFSRYLSGTGWKKHFGVAFGSIMGGVGGFTLASPAMNFGRSLFPYLKKPCSLFSKSCSCLEKYTFFKVMDQITREHLNEMLEHQSGPVFDLVVLLTRSFYKNYSIPIASLFSVLGCILMENNNTGSSSLHKLWDLASRSLVLSFSNICGLFGMMLACAFFLPFTGRIIPEFRNLNNVSELPELKAASDKVGNVDMFVLPAFQAFSAVFYHSLFKRLFFAPKQNTKGGNRKNKDRKQGKKNNNDKFKKGKKLPSEKNKDVAYLKIRILTLIATVGTGYLAKSLCVWWWRKKKD